MNEPIIHLAFRPDADPFAGTAANPTFLIAVDNAVYRLRRATSAVLGHHRDGHLVISEPDVHRLARSRELRQYWAQSSEATAESRRSIYNIPECVYGLRVVVSECQPYGQIDIVFGNAMITIHTT